QTRDEAARRLGVSLAKLKRRLERGRNLLRDRLTRRGLALAAAGWAAALVEEPVSAALARETARAALEFLTTGVSPLRADALLAGVDRSAGRSAARFALLLGAGLGAVALALPRPAPVPPAGPPA